MTAGQDPVARAFQLIRGGRRTVEQPLDVWLQENGISVGAIAVDDLIDLACVDLMFRRRAGFTVTGESYLEALPSLRTDAFLLDLIDAEICVADELGKPVSRSGLHTRFPTLKRQIDSLLDLGAVSLGRSFPSSPRQVVPDSDVCQQPKTETTAQTIVEDGLVATGNSSPPDYLLPRTSLQSELGENPTDARNRLSGADQIDWQLPVDLPDWFSAEQSVATTPGGWLIRGRDVHRGTLLALKVVELPKQFSQTQSTALLDRCEAAAKVSHPRWVAPLLATVHGSYFAVIRPWLHTSGLETPFLRSRPKEALDSDRSSSGQEFRDHGFAKAIPGAGPQEVARHLAELAFTIQAGHAMGVAHGAIHRANVMVDHHGMTLLVDAVANAATVSHETACLVDGDLRPRIQCDVNDFTQLVLSTLGAGDGVGSLTRQIRSISQRAPVSPPMSEMPQEGTAPADRGICGELGDTLMQFSDDMPVSGGALPQSRLRRAISRWMG